MAGCSMRDFDPYCDECAECDGCEECRRQDAYEAHMDALIDEERDRRVLGDDY